MLHDEKGLEGLITERPAKPAVSEAAGTRKGVSVARKFTTPGVHPADELVWDRRTAAITGEDGKVVFEQRDIEVPKSWSMLATNVVASKYFRGAPGTPEREGSVRTLIARVVNTIVSWGKTGGYFATPEDAVVFEAELSHLLLRQKAAFNSPVWFNLGVEKRPQTSACQPYHARVMTTHGPMAIGDIVERKLIGLPVYDGEGLAQVVAVKHNGSKPVYRIELRDGFSVEATGDHLVCAHSSRRTGRLEWRRVDQLEVGQYMRVYPHAAETVTPPGSPMEIAEAALAGWLQADGFVGQYAEGTNRSLTVEFMTNGDEEHEWVLKHLDTVFSDAHSHTREVETKDQEQHVRRIRLYGEHLRPFVDKYNLLRRGLEIRVPDAIFQASNDAAAAYLKSVFQADGYVSVHNASAHVAVSVVSADWIRGIQLLLSRFGIYSRTRKKNEKRDDRFDLWELDIALLSERAQFAKRVGFISKKKVNGLEESLDLEGRECPEIRFPEITAIRPMGEMAVYDIQTTSGQYLSGGVLVHNCFINSVEDTMESILGLAKTEGMLFKYGSGTGTNLYTLRGSKELLAGGGTASGPVSFMRGFDAFAGVIKSGGKTRRAAKMVILNDSHPDIRQFVGCKAEEEKKAWALIDAGYDPSFNGVAYSSVFFQNSNNSVRASDAFMRAVEGDSDWQTRAVRGGQVMDTFKARTLYREIAEATHLCGDPGMQFHDTIQKWHTCKTTGPINASNPCSEFIFLDDTACNLASLNLMHFRTPEGEFDVPAFTHAVDVLILAQEILVDSSSYPSEKIEKNSHAFRPLGLGFANLGALLMSRGLAYDSDEGRQYAGAITALMTGEAYAQSARIAGTIGPFQGYAANRDSMLNVIGMHRKAAYGLNGDLIGRTLLKAAELAWDDALSLGNDLGYRNAQVSVLAPTGCLVGGSLVATERGLVRLGTLGDPDGAKWQDVKFNVATDEGPKQATKFYVNGAEAVVTIDTARGHRIQGTPTHRIKVVNQETGEWVWKRFAEIEEDDLVPMSMNQLIGTPQEVPLPPLPEAYWAEGERQLRAPRGMSTELAELIGYFMGDGSFHSKGLRLCVAEKDTDVVERMKSLSKSLFNIDAHCAPKQGYTEVALHSVRLTLWWEACGFRKHEPHEGHSGKGYLPHIPNAVLYSNDPKVYGAFIRGLFEADGTVMSAGYPSWSSTSLPFSYDVQRLLLALGFPTTRKMDVTGWGQSTLAVLRLLNLGYGADFVKKIGFISARKRDAVRTGELSQVSRHDHIPVDRALIEALTPSNERLRATLLQQHRRTGAISRQTAKELHEATQNADLGHRLEYFYDRVASAELGEEQLTYDLSVPENVTYLANGFISHNTIGFMMDCDTTGIEPDIALIKYKKLVGGGVLKIVNGTVPFALKKLGYTDSEQQAILGFLEREETIEGAPGLKPEHLSVFDCAFKPAKGHRSIQWMGHVKMMSACQPFLSGAISKTVNLPSDAKVEDIEKAYLESWKLGLKAVAVYRDGCKRTQPLNTSKDAKDSHKDGLRDVTVPKGGSVRRKLPDERRAITHKFNIAGNEGYLTVGMYDDGTPGELFIVMAKEGSTISGLMDSFATSISLALQYGVPLSVLVEKFSHVRYEPSGFTGNKDIPIAKSLTDYIFRYLALKFLNRAPEPSYEAPAAPEPRQADSPAQLKLAIPNRAATFLNQSDAPPCSSCGSIMVRSGACYRCSNCGTTSGCS
jgi:ribonucleoside-diphosphate reductase alpha chain